MRVMCTPVTWSRERDFRLIRPLVYVTEEITRGFVESKGVPVVPCGCSLRTGTVRRSIRETIADWEIEHPHLRENILSAMGNIQHGRLLDTRYHDAGDDPAIEEEMTVPIPKADELAAYVIYIGFDPDSLKPAEKPKAPVRPRAARAK